MHNTIKTNITGEETRRLSVIFLEIRNPVPSKPEADEKKKSSIKMEDLNP